MIERIKEMKKKSLNERERDRPKAISGIQKKVLSVVLKLISYSNDSYTNDQFILHVHTFNAFLLKEEDKHSLEVPEDGWNDETSSLFWTHRRRNCEFL